MTQRTAEVLESFARLTETERHEVAVEILRREDFWRSEPMTDEELTAVAADAFAALDAEEAAHDQSATR